MQRQLQPIETEKYTELKRAFECRESHLIYTDRKVELEIAVLNRERIERFSGLLRQIIYPEDVSLYEVREEDINRYLVSHPKVLAKNFNENKFLFDDMTIYRDVQFLNSDRTRNVLNTKFVSKEQTIKSITLADVIIYSSPFVDSSGIFRGFNNSDEREKAVKSLFQMH